MPPVKHKTGGWQWRQQKQGQHCRLHSRQLLREVAKAGGDGHLLLLGQPRQSLCCILVQRAPPSPAGRRAAKTNSKGEITGPAAASSCDSCSKNTTVFVAPTLACLVTAAATATCGPAPASSRSLTNRLVRQQPGFHAVPALPSSPLGGLYGSGNLPQSVHCSLRALPIPLALLC